MTETRIKPRTVASTASLQSRVEAMRSLARVENANDIAERMLVNAKAIREEIRAYHVTSIRLQADESMQYGVDPTLQNPIKDLRDIAKVMLRIQGYRDRVVAITGDLHRKITKLNRVRHRCHIALIMQFTTGAKGEKTPLKEMFDIALEPLISRREELVDLFDEVQLVAKNLDSTHFTYKEVGALGLRLKQSMERQGGSDY